MTVDLKSLGHNYREARLKVSGFYELVCINCGLKFLLYPTELKDMEMRYMVSEKHTKQCSEIMMENIF